MLRKYAILLTAALALQTVYAQKYRLSKAESRYDTHSYIDAREIYLKVVDKGYVSAELFQKLGDTYYFNAEYGEAAQWYTRLHTEFPGETGAEYYFRAAQCYKNLGEHDKAEALMSKLREVSPGQAVVSQFKTNAELLDRILIRDEQYTVIKTTINSGFSDFSPSFYGMNKLVFASGATDNKVHDWNDQPFFNLFEATIANDGVLSGRRELDGDIKSGFNESSTAFTKDGQTVYFTRNNILKGRKAKRDVMRHKLYRATLENSQWSDVEELPFNDDAYSVAHPALSPDEKRLYFASDMPDTTGASDLWYVDILGDGQYSAPVNLGMTINTEARETFPFLSKDNTLYFASDGRYGMGGLDIYYVDLGEDGLPQGPVKTFGTPVNTPDDDFAFIIDEERELIYLSSNRDDAPRDNIYFLKKECEVVIAGLVTDVFDDKPLPGTLVVLLDENHDELERMTVGENARYSFTVSCETQYTVRGTKEDYHPKEETVSTPDITSEVDVPLALEYSDPCHPNDLGCRLSLQPIYFDFDKHNIRPDAAVELAKILAAMEEYSHIKIHIESHTDSRGSDAYNLALSERRAQSTRRWLIDNGIDASRLTARGYGETRLVNECSNGVPCTDEQHQLNRRSMFIIVD